MKKIIGITLTIIISLTVLIGVPLMFPDNGIKIRDSILSVSLGMAVADITFQTRTFKVEDLGNGRHAITSDLQPLQMTDDFGEWIDIDTTLDNKGIPAAVPYEVTPYLSGMPGFHFTSKFSGEWDVRLREARQDILSPTPINYNHNSKPSIEGNVITWVEFYDDVDITLTCFNGAVELGRVIKTADAPLLYYVDIEEVMQGDANLQPLNPARDSIGQQIEMAESSIVGGRGELLKLNVISPNAQSIQYPIYDSTIINNVTPTQSSDDAYELEGSNAVINSGTDWCWSGDSDRRWLGVRWAAEIPVGATINTCNVTPYVHGSYDDTNFYIHFQTGESPPTFSTGTGNISYRQLSLTSVEWQDTGLGAGRSTSPSLVTPMQSVVNGYSSTSSYVVCVFEPKTGAGDSNIYGQYSWDEAGAGTYAMQYYCEYTEAAGVSITSNVSSENLGTQYMNTTIYAFGSAPNNPVEAGDCTFALTNDGASTCNVTASMSDITGNLTLSPVSGTPGTNEFRITIYKEGDDPDNDGIVLGNDAVSFLEGMASSNVTNWDFKFETGDWAEVSGYSAHSGILQLTAVEP